MVQSHTKEEIISLGIEPAERALKTVKNSFQIRIISVGLGISANPKNIEKYGFLAKVYKAYLAKVEDLEEYQ